MPGTHTVTRDFPEFQEALHRIRLAQGLTLQALADRMGCTRQQIHQWEIGAYAPSFRLATQLADALGCSLDELAGREAHA